MGKLVDYRDDLIKEYGLVPLEARLWLIEAKNLLLGGFDPKLGEVATQILNKKGVELLMGRSLRAFKDDAVVLSDGPSIRAGTLVWTGGVQASHLVSSLGVETRGGRESNSLLRDLGYPGAYVVGDCALTLDPETGRPLSSIRSISASARQYCGV